MRDITRQGHSGTCRQVAPRCSPVGVLGPILCLGRLESPISATQGHRKQRQRIRQEPRALLPPYPSSSSSKRTLNSSLRGKLSSVASPAGLTLQPALPSFPSLELHAPAQTCFVLAHTAIPACLSPTTRSTPQARPGAEGGFVYVWGKEEGRE